MSPFNFEVKEGRDLLVEEKTVEIVERKGKGHPDSLCDGAAEKLSVALSESYRQAVGKILHHNVDKAVLVGGKSLCWFGGGEIIEPIKLYIVGRATEELNGKKLFNQENLENKIKQWLMEQVSHFQPEYLDVNLIMRCGSQDLVCIFTDEDQPPRANDTSLAVAHAPLSELERLVLEMEKFLNSPAGKAKFPALGEDIKIMGVRKDKTINLTIAAAFVASEVLSREHYEEIKREVTRYLLQDFVPNYTSRQVVINLNNADTENSAYLTVTGTSAEAGDDGQVGRGNRACGLITPYRPMSLEAIAGKNPVSHVGKIYSIMSQLVANQIVNRMPEVKQVYVYMVSRINEPITEPQAVNVELWGLNATQVKPQIKEIVDEVLGRWREIRDGFLEGQWPIY
ncbi:MAG: methionine adenosyltransferase [Candidatus Aminicenantes bacterium]|nr:methionine adenosyltransferase [Candidatus Aminicenantes bacterium]